jgi:putative peptidoglycan lipid II flippase
MGYRGLALGTALAAMFNAGALLWLLRRRLDGLEGRRITIAMMKIVAASIAMGAAAYATATWLAAAWPSTSTLVRLVHVFGAIAVAVAVLAGAARLLRIEEFESAVSRVMTRLTG